MKYSLIVSKDNFLLSIKILTLFFIIYSLNEMRFWVIVALTNIFWVSFFILFKRENISSLWFFNISSASSITNIFKCWRFKTFHFIKSRIHPQVPLIIWTPFSNYFISKSKELPPTVFITLTFLNYPNFNATLPVYSASSLVLDTINT